MSEGCPKCGQPLTPDTTITHCPGDAHASCWWSRHQCGAIVDMCRTHHWIDYPTRSTDAHEG